ALEDMRRLSAEDIDGVLRAARGIGAGPAAAPPPAPVEPRPAGYAPTFFPNATDVGAAATGTLGPAEGRNGIDVIAQMVPTARIDGRVRIQNGALPTLVTVTLSTATVQVPISGGTGAAIPTA